MSNAFSKLISKLSGKKPSEPYSPFIDHNPHSQVSDNVMRRRYGYLPEKDLKVLMMAFGHGPEAHRLREEDIKEGLRNPEHKVTLPVWALIAEQQRLYHKWGLRRAELQLRDDPPTESEIAAETNEISEWMPRPPSMKP